MKVQAYHLGKRILLKSLQTEFKFKPILRDPLIFEVKPKKYAVVFKYGVVVFWGLNKTDQKKFTKSIKPFSKESFSTHLVEEIEVLTTKESDLFEGNQIYLKGLTVEKVVVISLILGRSVALGHYENEVEKALLDFNPIMQSFQDNGKPGIRTRQLLKRVGFAMNVRHLTVSQMALLDRPDVIWEDTSLNKFYDELSTEFEIEDRYDVLKEKLDTIFRNVEFILGFMETKQSLFLELIIVILILVEILIFGYEIWFM